ncbi:hypothetical protein VDR72_20840, partial [Xanthomonas campestris pv. campestris]|nr:hypothetical protein [Xanthomonas campestris pv. campestris]
MFSIFKKQAAPLLIVRADGRELCRISQSDVPCEIKPSAWLKADSVLEFTDSAGGVHRHELGAATGWFHFSIRVHPGSPPFSRTLTRRPIKAMRSVHVKAQ